MASALSDLDEALFFIGMVCLMAVGLFCASPLARHRPLSWSAGLLLVVVLGAGGSVGLFLFFNFLGGVMDTSGRLATSTDRSRTAI
nr:hypothetical protein [Akkermansiaceae bacterium]